MECIVRLRELFGDFLASVLFTNQSTVSRMELACVLILIGDTYVMERTRSPDAYLPRCHGCAMDWLCVKVSIVTALEIDPRCGLRFVEGLRNSNDGADMVFFYGMNSLFWQRHY